MTWAILAAAVLLGAFCVRKAVAWLKPPPDDGKRRCPHCGHEFEGARRYCIYCKGQIWEDVLSEE